MKRTLDRPHLSLLAFSWRIRTLAPKGSVSMSSDATASAVPSRTSWAHRASASPGAWNVKPLPRDLRSKWCQGENENVQFPCCTWMTGTPRCFRSSTHDLVRDDAAGEKQNKKPSRAELLTLNHIISHFLRGSTCSRMSGEAPTSCLSSPLQLQKHWQLALASSNTTLFWSSLDSNLNTWPLMQSHVDADSVTTRQHLSSVSVKLTELMLSLLGNAD